MRGPGLVERLRQQRTALLLVVFVLGVAAGTTWMPSQVPISILAIPLVLGAILLGPRALPWFVGFTTLVIAGSASIQATLGLRASLSALSMLLLCLIVFVVSVRRNPLGIGGLRGESMFVDLRDRILAQGAIPDLPDRWLVESALLSAGGSPFAGDFVVATTRGRGRTLEVAVVDVSGKGEAAGTRALQLSGAMGGLLAAVPPAQFLTAANDYLLQRAWDEGFATAIHLSLDLATGGFELRTAGHPPPAQRLAGSGRWLVLRGEGPVLGLLEDVDYAPLRGRLDPGDALLLYTDGMVEEPRRDIDLGLDAMLGEAEQLCRRSFDGLADRLAARVGSPDDDRALLLVHRRR